MSSLSDFLLFIYSWDTPVNWDFALPPSIYSWQDGMLLSNNCGDKKIHIRSWMPWYSLMLILLHASQFQSKKNNHVSLVLLCWVANLIQKEIIHHLRKWIVAMWMLLPLPTCIELWCGSLRLPITSWNHCQTLVGILIFRPFSSQISSRLWEKAEIKNSNKIGVSQFPCVTRNDIFSIKWRYYGTKQDILDYWETLIYFLLSYYILSMDKGL